MAQHDYVLANASGAAYRVDNNDVLQAILSGNSGATAPSVTEAYMIWNDTNTGHLKQRNAANTAWIDHGPLASAILRVSDVAAGGSGGLLRADGDGSGLSGIATQVPAGIAESININSNTANPNYQIGYSIEDIALKDSGGAIVYATMTGTLDIETSGVNGLDTGLEAPSTFYYIHAIAQSDGTGALLLSASSTAPNKPTGYDYSALVGAVRNNASSNFIPFFQYGNSVSYYAQQNVLAAGQATTETAIDYSAFVPPIARRLTANVEAQQTDTTLDAYAALRHIAANDFIRMYVGQNTAGNRNFNTSQIQIPYTGNFFYTWSTPSAGRFFEG